MPRACLRLLRTSDLTTIKALHRQLFGFDITVSEQALEDALRNPRWTCLASVCTLPDGTEAMAGFVLAAVGTLQEFRQSDYFGDKSRSQTAESATSTIGSANSSSHIAQDNMGLDQLNMAADDVLCNVCLLATLPMHRRQGIASQLFSQIISSARNAQAKGIFLHVIDGNTSALRFYERFGFKVVTRVARFYQLEPDSSITTARSDETSDASADTDTVLADALLLSAEVTDVLSANSTQQGSGRRSNAVTSPAVRGGGAAPAQTPAAAAPVAPKMRGLMGTSSRSRTTHRQRGSAPAEGRPVDARASNREGAGNLIGKFLQGLSAITPSVSGVSDLRSASFGLVGGQQPAGAPQTSVTSPFTKDCNQATSTEDEDVVLNLQTASECFTEFRGRTIGAGVRTEGTSDVPTETCTNESGAGPRIRAVGTGDVTSAAIAGCRCRKRDGIFRVTQESILSRRLPAHQLNTHRLHRAAAPAGWRLK